MVRDRKTYKFLVCKKILVFSSSVSRARNSVSTPTPSCSLRLPKKPQMNLDVLLNVTSSLLSTNFVQSLVSTVESIPASAVLRDAAQHIGKTFEAVYQFVVEISNPIPIHFEFTELQTTLLIVFLIIIAVNILLIVFYWSKYGGVITDRFIRPSTLKEIEELKLSVAKLKLPFEHTPRL